MNLPDATAITNAQQRQLLDSYEIRALLDELVEVQTVPIAQILRGTGVTARQLANPSQRLTLEQELAVYTRIAQCNRDPSLGIRVGARLTLPHYGILGYAMMGATTLQEVLQLLADFTPLLSWASHGQLSQEQRDGVPCTCLTIVPTAVEARAAALEIESTFASLQTIFTALLGERLTFAEIDFTHSLQASVPAPFTQLFGCRLNFGRSRNVLCLPRALLARRLQHPQPEFSELFRDLCQQSMAQLTQERGLVGTIKSLLQMTPGKVPTLEQVAAHFHQSPRNLRRQLRARGVGFQDLLDEVRYAQARQYLTATALTVESIARQLGYADPRSFRTAFKRWSQMTPGAFRRRQPGQD